MCRQIPFVAGMQVWDGKAELEEIEADAPKGHWEGLTLFLYNPSAQVESVVREQGRFEPSICREFYSVDEKARRSSRTQLAESREAGAEALVH
jgi:hypothetical protein